MQTQFLLAHFGKDVLFAHSPLPTLPLEDGVRLMSIVPVRADSCVFLGDYSAWLLLCKGKNCIPVRLIWSALTKTACRSSRSFVTKQST